MIRATIGICAALAGRRTDDWNVFGLPRAIDEIDEHRQAVESEIGGIATGDAMLSGKPRMDALARLPWPL